MVRMILFVVLGALGSIGGCPNPGAGTANDNSGANSNGSTQSTELGVEIAIDNEGATHVATGTTVAYRHNPPASGPHWPTPASRGFYTAAVDAEQWVHNLEHGYVVILYDCHGPCDSTLLSNLETLAGALPKSSVFGYSKIVITPYDGLPDGVLLTAVAWDVLLNLAEFDETALREFFDAHQDQGPELAG